MDSPNHWRTAALLGPQAAIDDLIEALTTVMRARGVPTPMDEEWDPLEAALWLHGVVPTAIDGRPYGWTLLWPRKDEGPLRPLEHLAIDIVCVAHTDGVVWELPGEGARFPFSCALSRAGLEATLHQWAPEAVEHPPMLEPLVAAWEAIPARGRPSPEIHPGRRLLCAECGAPVTGPVLLVSAEENAAVLAHDRLSRGNEWIGPGLCLAAFSTDRSERCWFVEPLDGPVTRCPNGHEVGHRTTHLTGGQGELDARDWRVAALRRERVRWEGGVAPGPGSTR